MAKILIVEDDEEIALLEHDYLEIGGYEVEVKNDGINVAEMIINGDYDLLILDLMLPGISGYDICKKIRDKVDIPILMVTAKTETIDKIRGLGLGADDYIAKPFDPAELLARVQAHLKQYDRLTKNRGWYGDGAEGCNDVSGIYGNGITRNDITRSDVNRNAVGRHTDNENLSGSNRKADEIDIGNLRIMLRGWKVYKDGEEIKFPNKEFELLKFLATNPNIVFSKEALFEKIWGYDYAGDSATVMVHINRIREKIENDPRNPQIIETVWGAGYRLNL